MSQRQTGRALASNHDNHNNHDRQDLRQAKQSVSSKLAASRRGVEALEQLEQLAWLRTGSPAPKPTTAPTRSSWSVLPQADGMASPACAQRSCWAVVSGCIHDLRRLDRWILRLDLESSTVCLTPTGTRALWLREGSRWDEDRTRTGTSDTGW